MGIEAGCSGQGCAKVPGSRGAFFDCPSNCYQMLAGTRRQPQISGPTPWSLAQNFCNLRHVKSLKQGFGGP